MERRPSSSSPLQPPYVPCLRAHNSFFDLRNPPPFNYSPLNPCSYSQPPQVNLGKPLYRQRFQKVVKKPRPRQGPRNAKDSAHDTPFEGNPTNKSKKMLLHELCAFYKWKPPLFDCHKEEGPSHQKRFIFKVLVEIKGNEATIVEAFSESKPSKKSAAEHAAEGALWYLKHLSYYPKKK